MDPQVMAQAAMFDVAPLTGVKVQGRGRINWSHKYNDNDAFTLGGEYFYNQPATRRGDLPGPAHQQALLARLGTSSTRAGTTPRSSRRSGAYSWNLTTSRSRRWPTSPISRSSRASTARTRC